MEKKLWFKRKKFGYGWTPVSWEGWVVTIVYIALLLFLGFSIGEEATDKEAIFKLLIPMAVFTAVLVKIGLEHGEKPEWSWGRGKNNHKQRK